MLITIADKENGNGTHASNKNIFRHGIIVGTDGVLNYEIISQYHRSDDKNERRRDADNTNAFSQRVVRPGEMIW
jgi:hypothetical protein